MWHFRFNLCLFLFWTWKFASKWAVCGSNQTRWRWISPCLGLESWKLKYLAFVGSFSLATFLTFFYPSLKIKNKKVEPHSGRLHLWSIVKQVNHEMCHNRSRNKSLSVHWYPQRIKFHILGIELLHCDRQRRCTTFFLLILLLFFYALSMLITNLIIKECLGIPKDNLQYFPRTYCFTRKLIFTIYYGHETSLQRRSC